MKAPLAACLLAISAPAIAEEAPLAASLIADAGAFTPGATVMVGVRLQPQPGYHTYWKHPGIVGMPTTIEWTLPPGFTAGDPRWPAPQVVQMARYTAQGYPGESLVMVPIRVPDHPGDVPVTLTAHVSWMCCGKKCYPANRVPLHLSLPTREAPVAPASVEIFRRHEAQVPRRDDAWSADVRRQADAIHLTLRPRLPDATTPVAALGAVRFFTADGQVDSDAPQPVERDPATGTLRLTLRPSALVPPPSDARLPGVLVAERPWRKDTSFTALELP